MTNRLNLDEIKVTADDPDFFERVFLAISKHLKKKPIDNKNRIHRIICEEYGNLSRRLDLSLFQESCSVRNVLKTRKLADALISEEGELKVSLLPGLIKYLKNHLYVLGPRRQFDAIRHTYLLKVLESLYEDKSIQTLIKIISKPYSHKIAEQVIRDTLLLEPHVIITDTHAKKAALSAWMCYLRQNVGSCFATAPAIIVQQEQAQIFFKDINELMGTGRIKRVVAGTEYVVPLSITWGAGDLRKPVLIDPTDETGMANVAYSPGILLALEKTQILKAKENLKDRIEEAKNLCLMAIKKFAKESSTPFYLSAEVLLKEILQKHLNLTEKDVEDYSNRPKEMLQTSLIMTQPFPISGGKGNLVENYLNLLENSKNAFKALADNALLKTWEFTLASFAETQPGFTRWNMYASLGFNAEDRGGIGHCLYEEIKRKLDQTNLKVQELQQDYEMVYSQLKFLEGRVRSASSEKELQWIRVEHQSKKNEFNTLEEIRDREHFKAKRFAELFNEMLEAYDHLFPQYFQEVYDADMHEVATGPYDDSPAGFRLLYKHGRANSSLWTLIYRTQDFVESLASFFIATEPGLVNDERFQGLEDDVGQLITKIVTHVKTEQFIESAFDRMAVAHQMAPIKTPLQNLDKIDKKPWAYTSGGTINNLISCYFRLDGKPAEQERWVENPMELLVFLTDSLKQTPYALLQKYLEDPFSSLLIHSPTHAFTLRPSFSLFKAAIQSEAFSYTWIRDHLVIPAERFIESQFLQEEELQFILEKLIEIVPGNFKPRFRAHFSTFKNKQTVTEFRKELALVVRSDKGLRIGSQSIISFDEVDAFLNQSLPLTPSNELSNRIEKILENLPGITSISNLNSSISSIGSRWGASSFVTAKQLFELAISSLTLYFEKTAAPFDYPHLIAIVMQKKGYSMPQPILFADTNWVKDNFAFLINPGTGRLELWRSDYIGMNGMPMSSWSEWLDGSRKDRKWGIYLKPHQYKLLI